MAYLDPSNFDSPLNVTAYFGFALPSILGRGRLMSEREVVGGRQPVHSPHIRSWDTQSWRVAPGSSHISLSDRLDSYLVDSLRPAYKLCANLQQVTASFASASASEAIQLWLSISPHTYLTHLAANLWHWQQTHSSGDANSGALYCTTLTCIRCSVQLRLENYREVCGLTQFLPANGRTIPRIRPTPLRSESFPIH